MKIAIIGAGALGSLFGGLLSKQNHEVWLYNPSNRDHIYAIRDEGLKIQSSSDEFIVRPHAVCEIDEIPNPVDLVGIFVKAYDTDAAMQAAKPILKESTWTLSLQNGMGPEEAIGKYVLPQNVLRGTTAQGAALIKPGSILWGGRGPTKLGILEPSVSDHSDELSKLCQLFGAADWETSVEGHIEPLLWEKLLVNAAINPLTAIFGVRNGMLIKDKGIRGLFHSVIAEALPVVREKNVNVSLGEAIELVEEVCSATAENISSMLQDVRRKKRTEIDYINGVIVRLAEDLGIETPLNSMLTRLLMQSR
jgi:2-dehydropantoate 2-reductase